MRANSLPTPYKRGGGGNYYAPSVNGTPKITRQARHMGSASADASPAALGLARRPVSRRLLAREAAAEVDGGDWGSDYDPADADADYMPSGRPMRASTRAMRASARGVAAAATSAPSGAAAAPPPAAASSGGGGGGGRWSGEPKALISGPCMNPGEALTSQFASWLGQF